jgi:hypothetical protein
MPAPRPTARQDPSEPCRNCGDATPGPYCPRCGQRKALVRVSVRALVRDFLEDQFGVERRTPSTLFALFFRPGFLTREYIEGRRVRYIHPLRLYLVSSLLLFLVAGFMALRGGDAISVGGDVGAGVVTGFTTPGADTVPPAAAASSPDTLLPPDTTTEAAPVEPPWYETVRIDTGNARIDGLIRARLTRLGQMEGAEAVREVLQTVLNYTPTLLFLLLPVFAGVLKLLYIRSGRYYSEHLVFVLHLHAFVFGVFLVGIGASLAGIGVVPGILAIWAAVYGFLAMRRVYGEGKLRTAVKYWTLGWMYFWILVTTVPVMVILGLLAGG